MSNGTGRVLHSSKVLLSAPPWHRRGIQQLFGPVAATAGQSYTRTIPGEYWERLLSVSFTLATSATVANRTLAFNFASGDGYVFNSTPISNEIVASTTISGYGDLTYVTPVEAPTSNENEGSQTTPAALTTIATVALPAGGWHINWTVGLAGTTSATEVDNFGLYDGSTLVLQSENGDTAQGTWPQTAVDVEVPPAGATYNVKNIAAGTSGAVYTASIVATSANVPAAQFTIPDLILEPGWQMQIALGNAQSGDQLTGIGLLLERYASDAANGGWELEREAMLDRIIDSALRGQ
jgi:hypothetical protein